MSESPSSPPSAEANPQDALAWYKSQYELLEQELSEFQASSKELEAELEKDLDAADKRERALQKKAESLSYEVEEWKVLISPYERTRVTVWLTRPTSENTRNPNPRQMRRKAFSRKRSPPFAKQTGPCSSDYGTSR